MPHIVETCWRKVEREYGEYLLIWSQPEGQHYLFCVIYGTKNITLLSKII